MSGYGAARSSTQLFPRDWKVIVGDQTAAAVDVSNLDLEFKILATLKPEPNKALVTLWNLNNDKRAAMLKRNQPNGANGKIVGVPVQVEAGYVNQTSVLFSGDLREVASVRDDTDWKTTLSGDDGGRAYRQARFGPPGTQFAAGTSIGNILKQACQGMGIGLGNAANFEATAQIAGIGSTLAGPLTLDGSASAGLTKLLNSIGLTWSIQRGALQLLQKGKPLNASAIKLSPSTGLLDSPESAIDATVSLGNPQQFAPGAKQSQQKVKPKDPGILKLKAMLIPGLVPGRKIDLESASFNGGYYITECEYVGQSWANDWHVNCVVRIY